MATLKEIYGEDLSDFEDLLDEAKSQAETNWEIDFVDEMEERYETYGETMFLSEKQEDALQRIANK